MKTKQPHEKFGVSETTFLFTYSAGWNSAYRKSPNPYQKGTAQYKIWQKGKRDSKKVF